MYYFIWALNKQNTIDPYIFAILIIVSLIETSELTSKAIFAHLKAYKGGLCKYELETNIVLCVKAFVPMIYGF